MYILPATYLFISHKQSIVVYTVWIICSTYGGTRRFCKIICKWIFLLFFFLKHMNIKINCTTYNIFANTFSHCKGDILIEIVAPFCKIFFWQFFWVPLLIYFNCRNNSKIIFNIGFFFFTKQCDNLQKSTFDSKFKQNVMVHKNT